MKPLGPFLESVAARIERLQAVDGVAEALVSVLGRAVPAGPVRDVASGTPLGHPAHPLLVAVPIGSFLGAGYLDLTSPRNGRAAARRLIGFGLVAAVPSAYAGMSDWMDTDGAERRVGLVHAVLNAAALSLYGGSWLARGRGRRGLGLALAGAGLLGAGGWFGGHLAYALGVGVDTTVFEQFPDEWTDVAASADLPPGRPVRVDVGGVALFLLRTGSGIVALADRCSHRGGPLDEGELDGDCITCPWHGSRFDVRDGSVRGGPASRPQPTLETRERDDRVWIRRPGEQRSLRTNPV